MDDTIVFVIALFILIAVVIGMISMMKPTMWSSEKIPVVKSAPKTAITPNNNGTTLPDDVTGANDSGSNNSNSSNNSNELESELESDNSNGSNNSNELESEPESEAEVIVVVAEPEPESEDESDVIVVVAEPEPESEDETEVVVVVDEPDDVNYHYVEPTLEEERAATEIEKIPIPNFTGLDELLFPDNISVVDFNRFHKPTSMNDCSDLQDYYSTINASKSEKVFTDCLQKLGMCDLAHQISMGRCMSKPYNNTRICNTRHTNFFDSCAQVYDLSRGLL